MHIQERQCLSEDMLPFKQMLKKENFIQRINKKFYAKYNSTTYRLNYDVAKAKLLYKKPIESSVQS